MLLCCSVCVNEQCDIRNSLLTHDGDDEMLCGSFPTRQGLRDQTSNL